MASSLTICVTVLPLMAVTGLNPRPSAPRARCATKLRYTPKDGSPDAPSYGANAKCRARGRLTRSSMSPWGYKADVVIGRNLCLPSRSRGFTPLVIRFQRTSLWIQRLRHGPGTIQGGVLLFCGGFGC